MNKSLLDSGYYISYGFEPAYLLVGKRIDEVVLAVKDRLSTREVPSELIEDSIKIDIKDDGYHEYVAGFSYKYWENDPENN